MTIANENGEDRNSIYDVALPGANDGAAALVAESLPVATGNAGFSGECRVIAGACPSNTHLQSSQEVIPFSPEEATFAIDWLESSGCILWDESISQEHFWRLDQLQLAARQAKQPQLVTLGPMTGLLHGQGFGSGHQSHLEYRFESRGVLFAISQRKEPSRQLSNFYLKVSGEPCLIEGAIQARQTILEVVKVLGGVVVDEWPRRLDICLDLPGLDLNDELQPVFDRGQFLTSAKKWNPFDGREGKTGFTVGSRSRIRCIVYDKLLDSVANHDPVYLQAMIDRRWNGTPPEHATRIEYQIGREWLANQEGIKTVDETLGRLGDIATRLLSHERLPFFCLTSSVPDRKNKHQSRAEVLPLWDRIVKTMQVRAGDRFMELRPIRRNAITAMRAYQMVRGFLTTVGAQLEIVVESMEDGIEVLKELERRNDGNAADWESRWEAKARKAGTYKKVTAFEFGNNQAV